MVICCILIILMVVGSSLDSSQLRSIESQNRQRKMILTNLALTFFLVVAVLMRSVTSLLSVLRSTNSTIGERVEMTILISAV